MMHKYLPDGSLGSSWHPYIRNGKFHLPIQEDETALVIWALGAHYDRTHDIEFIEDIYNDMVVKAADFMCMFRSQTTKLPSASYDLWEEKFGTSTFTSSAVFGALTVATNLSELLGKMEKAQMYKQVAEEIRENILKYLYDSNTGNFLKLIVRNTGENKIIPDATLDASSAFGIFNFGVLPSDDKRLKQAMKQTKEGLTWKEGFGGVVRYAGDRYYTDPGNPLGNPWIITTLWMTQWAIAQATKEEDFEDIRKQLDWVEARATPAGILSEQINPWTGEQISAAPLTWSHAEFINTVTKYLDRLEELGFCKACNPVP
jgi:GH15 family glucan-1,4-alpha-glucosidase